MHTNTATAIHSLSPSDTGQYISTTRLYCTSAVCVCGYFSARVWLVFTTHSLALLELCSLLVEQSTLSLSLGLLFGGSATGFAAVVVVFTLFHSLPFTLTRTQHS